MAREYGKAIASESRTEIAAIAWTRRIWKNLMKELDYLVEYRFRDVRGLPWGDSGGKGGVTEDTLSDSVECAIAGTSLGSKILLNSDSTMSTHSESCTAKEQQTKQPPINRQRHNTTALERKLTNDQRANDNRNVEKDGTWTLIDHRNVICSSFYDVT